MFTPEEFDHFHKWSTELADGVVVKSFPPQDRELLSARALWYRTYCSEMQALMSEKITPPKRG
ncbi:hypothetical protein UFOVP669_42 [uncultured Caudovirales phage]|uniref:Uncharacterized protein n=1 Tax=uncultured Caudovirales phage TaxID=2100421 RepID=A0A6J5SHA6_9CAUD|nr:hypothetical protein UFOVP400_33 [uncultured Caudovirales phage]CAB4156078.1 hypothetical protein UFOVP669_42 [uncultured Caudovirales phage]CAB4213480.1 hypothetical protein UFOVP1449_30 [uncultured Caudovirales phage]